MAKFINSLSVHPIKVVQNVQGEIIITQHPYHWWGSKLWFDSQHVVVLGGVPCAVCTSGSLHDLPEPEEDVVIITSELVCYLANTELERYDVVTPQWQGGQPERDEWGFLVVRFLRRFIDENKERYGLPEFVDLWEGAA